jgi:hypothetical protein
MSNYPKVKESSLVGTYPALVKSGGGYVWDAVLEYRVWCSPRNGAPDTEDGDDYYYVFDNYKDALTFSEESLGAEEPIALILQEEYIDESTVGEYKHIKEQRLTEWPVEFLSRPKRAPNTITDFFSPNAPTNRLDVLRGLD